MGTAPAATPPATAAASVPFDALPFGVIDVETTGLTPELDRVVELAVVRIDRQGEVERELHTLIDPGQPMTATEVHGITDQDVAGAPCFADVAGEITALLDGTVVVAHNAPFDTGFLRAEITGCGHELGPLPYICTMRMRRQVRLPGPSAHKLRWACWQEGVPIESAHAAVCDARATGALLSRYLTYASECGHSCLGDLKAHGVAADSWRNGTCRLSPVATAPGASLRQRNGVAPTPLSLHRQVQAPADAVRAYELSLVAAAEDFEVDGDEVKDLHHLVGELGLTSDQVRAVHVAHVQRLLDDRLADGLLTWSEQQEVRSFARLLGVPGRTLDQLLARAGELGTIESGPTARETAGTDLTVCFTGEFVAIPLSREEVSELALESGMQVAPRVTKKLDMLVCLDPEAGTGKLNKAAEYGTVIIDQATFLAVAGVEPAPEGIVSSVLAQLAERREAQASQGERKREQAADRARTRARDRARQRRASPSAEQILWCAAGQHEWSRPPQRGRPPRACPGHTEGLSSP